MIGSANIAIISGSPAGVGTTVPDPQTGGTRLMLPEANLSDAAREVKRMRRAPECYQEEFIYPFVQSGEFEIDDEGRVWRVLRNGGACERVRAEHRPKKNGYLVVRRMVNGRRYYTGAHRLVWRHFNGPIPANHTINHKNGVKDCNRPDNLEPKTHSGNTKHAYDTGLMDEHGEANPHAKLSDNEVVQIRLAYATGKWRQIDLAKKYGVTFQAISEIVRGKSRPKQLGPVSEKDHRYCASEKDPSTGRFVSRKAS